MYFYKLNNNKKILIVLYTYEFENIKVCPIFTYNLIIETITTFVIKQN